MGGMYDWRYEVDRLKEDYPNEIKYELKQTQK